jgi:hypothetical protein
MKRFIDSLNMPTKEKKVLNYILYHLKEENKRLDDFLYRRVKVFQSIGLDKALKTVLENGYLSDTGVYTIGEKPYGYRFTRKLFKQYVEWFGNNPLVFNPSCQQRVIPRNVPTLVKQALECLPTAIKPWPDALKTLIADCPLVYDYVAQLACYFEDGDFNHVEYTVSKTGRIYTPLQNMPRDLKAYAFNGYYDLDVTMSHVQFMGHLVGMPIDEATLKEWKALRGNTDNDKKAFIEAFGSYGKPLYSRYPWTRQLKHRFKTMYKNNQLPTHNACGIKYKLEGKKETEKLNKAHAFYLQGYEAAFIHHLTILGEKHGYMPLLDMFDGLITDKLIPSQAVEEASRNSGLITTVIVSPSKLLKPA